MPAISDNVRSVALGDVDGDGDLDVVVGSVEYGYFGPSGGRNRLYLNNGLGTFTDAPAGHMPAYNENTMAVALGDVDGDGDLDMVAANCAGCYYNSWSANPQNRLYLNDGTGTFLDVTATRLPVDSDATAAVALGDVDGDGDMDIVFGDCATGRLYFNLSGQLHAPVELRVGQTYTLDAYLRHQPQGAGDFALPYLSLATASIVVPPFGTLGIDPSLAAALPLIQIPQPAGVGTLQIPIVNNSGLLGLSIYAQALLVPRMSQAQLSNVVPDVLLR